MPHLSSGLTSHPGLDSPVLNGSAFFLDTGNNMKQLTEQQLSILMVVSCFL